MKKNLLIALMLVFANICFAQNTQQTKVPVTQIPALYAHKIKDVTTFKTKGQNYNLIFTTVADHPKENNVRFVYIAPDNFTGEANNEKRNIIYPPEVRKLIYHNLGDDNKSFCGVITREDTYNQKGIYIGKKYKETVVPDEIAQKIMDLIANDTQWTNKTDIMFYETPDKNLFPTQIR